MFYTFSYFSIYLSVLYILPYSLPYSFHTLSHVLTSFLYPSLLSDYHFRDLSHSQQNMLLQKNNQNIYRATCSLIWTFVERSDLIWKQRKKIWKHYCKCSLNFNEISDCIQHNITLYRHIAERMKVRNKSFPVHFNGDFLLVFFLISNITCQVSGVLKLLCQQGIGLNNVAYTRLVNKLPACDYCIHKNPPLVL
jgi:hypothetical protein